MPRRRCWLPLVVLVVLGAFGHPTTPAEATDVVLSLERNPRDVTIEAFRAATDSVSASVYEFKDPALVEAVRQAAERGVLVRLLVDGDESRKSKSMVDRARRAGAEVRTWDDGELHAKFVVFDRRLALAGSYNWTLGGAGDNVEVILTFAEPRTIEAFHRAFAQLWSRGRARR